jgi:hypothetical protein
MAGTGLGFGISLRGAITFGTSTIIGMQNLS